MIKYIGSKRTLVPTLKALVAEFPELTSVADVFSGTSRVGHACKRAGLRVWANDHNTFAHCLATCYVQADHENWHAQARKLVDEFSRLPATPGYVTETFCERARFFQPQNGARIDAIREAIAAKSLPPELEAVMLTSLVEAADRVDSTCGVQMAYVKKWAKRSYNALELRTPELLPKSAYGGARASCLDASLFAAQADCDIAYLDPPYNQHSYLSNYHIWESIVRWDKPEVYGVACKRVDCRTRKSAFNGKRRHVDAFAATLDALRAKLIVVSFNNEGYQSREQLEASLSARGLLFVVTKAFKRYVGAQIGIYSPTGAKVGAVSHLRNEEYIYVVATPELTAAIPDAEHRLSRFAALVDDRLSEHPNEQAHGVDSFDRVSKVEHALREQQCPMSLRDIQRVTGLSDYQSKTAVETLQNRGLLVSSGARCKCYALRSDDMPGRRS